MRGISPAYLDKLDESQRRTILTGPGKFFADNFLFVPGEHAYVLGPTGSGKTNKNYNLVNWLKHTDVILWISASKDNDIAPLFFMGKPVNIIIPKYADIDVTLGGEPVHYKKSVVSTPEDVLYAIRNDHINILEVRRAFYDRDNLLDWMIELFKLIAEKLGNGTMPTFHPDKGKGGRKTRITVFLDESQWLIAGSRVTNDPKRVKATSIITENALEIRTYGWRLVISAQGFTNTPPALRENMACAIICNNAEIDEPARLRAHCHPGPNSIWVPASHFRRNECKFVNRYGESMPKRHPLPWPQYPKFLEPCPIYGCRSLTDSWEGSVCPWESRFMERDKIIDRDNAARMRIAYGRTYHDQKPDSAEIEEELLPELGRFSAMAIPPEKIPAPEYSRWNA